MAGTLQFLKVQSPATATPPFRIRHLRLPTSQFSFLSSRTLGVSRLSITPVSTSTVVVRASTNSQSLQGDDGGKQLSLLKTGNWAEPILKFASSNFLPLALVTGVTLGFVNPTLGCLAHKYHLTKFSTFGIFIISGLTLRSDAIGAAAEAWPVGLFGLVSILFLTPLFSNVIMLVKLQPQEFITGLAIFSCMPTTLSSGAALTQLAGGNSALALAMTVLSNLLGILVIPFSISKFIASGVGVSVPTEQLLRSLVLTLLLPLILGKVLRESTKSVADFCDRNRKLLSVMNAALLSLVPWMQISRSRSLLMMVKPAVFLQAVCLGVLLHAALLLFNGLAMGILSTLLGEKSPFAKKQNATAVLLVASQKTLPVMVSVVEQLGGAIGVSGLLVLPCVAAHLNQIVFDSFLVSLWLQKANTLEVAKAA
ncbi:OLC1v1026350C1 [Oldenlandia corymbosa var. corymbosa]|uniref:Probable sodium/metabolite cotransporter BASS4, chloroplastic n=1 Tax=Oldenlandia corymbosa var. corymbosa TaxID=529605 RepID=A0AAV1C7G5_OLDCO|nr:OLC1v1026350C1 [Oldenlandia corymbosa var. corymbosa]